MPTPSPDPADLQTAIEESHYLLAYFRHKAKIPKNQRGSFNDAVKDILSFPAGGQATPSRYEIIDFWNAFITLLGIAYPVTIERIRYYFWLKDRPWYRMPFSVTTLIALTMTIGLSLLSYIATTALNGYDADDAHWSQMQMLVRYLAKATRRHLRKIRRQRSGSCQ